MNIDEAIEKYSERWINTEQVKRLLNIKADQTVLKIIHDMHNMGLAVRWVAKNIETTPGAVMEYSKRITERKMNNAERREEITYPKSS